MTSGGAFQNLKTAARGIGRRIDIRTSVSQLEAIDGMPEAGPQIPWGFLRIGRRFDTNVALAQRAGPDRKKLSRPCGGPRRQTRHGSCA